MLSFTAQPLLFCSVRIRALGYTLSKLATIRARTCTTISQCVILHSLSQTRKVSYPSSFRNSFLSTSQSHCQTVKKCERSEITSQPATVSRMLRLLDRKDFITHITISIVSTSAFLASSTYLEVLRNDVDGLRLMPAQIVVCITGRNYECREPESFIMKTNQVCLLLQRERHYLYFKAVCCTDLNNNPEKGSFCVSARYVEAGVSMQECLSTKSSALNSRPFFIQNNLGNVIFIFA